MYGYGINVKVKHRGLFSTFDILKPDPYFLALSKVATINFSKKEDF